MLFFPRLSTIFLPNLVSMPLRLDCSSSLLDCLDSDYESAKRIGMTATEENSRPGIKKIICSLRIPFPCATTHQSQSSSWEVNRFLYCPSFFDPLFKSSWMPSVGSDVYPNSLTLSLSSSLTSSYFWTKDYLRLLFLTLHSFPEVTLFVWMRKM